MGPVRGAETFGRYVKGEEVGRLLLAQSDRLAELEAEVTRLRERVAELSLQKQLLGDLLNCS
jgi:hypothetical protein